MKRSILLTVSLLSLVILSGCSTYKGQSKALTLAWQAGDGLTASTNVTLNADKSLGGKDELLWRLEQGAVLSAIGDFDGGLVAFDQAEEIVNRYEEEAKRKAGSEVLALLSNQANLPYRGRAYDKVMMNTFKALNYLSLMKPDSARIELNRAMQRQKDAVAENQKKIEKSLEAAEQSRQGALQDEAGSSAPSYDVDRAQQDPKFSSGVNAQMAVIDERILPYADYVNPFTVFLDGLFFSHLGLDNSDVERARKSFERVKGMSPGSYISADYVMAEAMASGAPAETRTYILFATGSAPSRSSIRIDLPLFLLTDEISYIGASFPRLKYHDNYIPQLTATAAGTSLSSERLCSMDAVISRDFKNEWPVMMTKTLLTTVTKAIAGRAAEELARKNGDYVALIAAKAASVAYQAASNIADLRTWTTLPKEFAYIRMLTPADGQVSLQIGMISQTVSVTPGKTNILMVRSINNTALPIIEQFTLN